MYLEVGLKNWLLARADTNVCQHVHEHLLPPRDRIVAALVFIRVKADEVHGHTAQGLGQALHASVFALAPVAGLGAGPRRIRR